MHTVIVGAGPIGLYLAIQLHLAGVKNLVVYDPRAGDYTRPGHINKDILERLQDVMIARSLPEKRIHIKDIERGLYAKAKSLGIAIETKKFVGFHKNIENPGVLVAREGGVETVFCDYVFDCTGSKRELVRAVNALHRDKPPFVISPIAEVAVKHHYLAYVRMNYKHFKLLQKAKSNLLSDIQWARSMEKLRHLGWSQWNLPQCHAKYFGKGKVCLYVEMPDGVLPPEKQRVWLETVLESVTQNKSIRFWYLPKGKKDKPRLKEFTVFPQELNRFAYQSDGLPMVLIEGDAQIDPVYVLGHGIIDGLDRVDTLVRSLGIIEGKIARFDPEAHKKILEPELKQHRDSIQFHYTLRNRYFMDGLLRSLLVYKSVIEEALGPEREAYQKTLLEATARALYIISKTLMERTVDAQNHVRIAERPVPSLIESLEELEKTLLGALEGLPTSCVLERKGFEKMLHDLAFVWKTFGNYLAHHKMGDESAIFCYQKSLKLFQLPFMLGLYRTEELAVYFNLYVIYSKTSNTEALLQTAINALNRSTSNGVFVEKKQQIVFATIKDCLRIVDQRCTALRIPEAKELLRQTRDFYLTYQHLLIGEQDASVTSLFMSLHTALAEPEQAFRLRASNQFFSSKLTTQDTSLFESRALAPAVLV